MKQLANVYEKIAATVIGSYKKIENGVVNAYKTIENGAVNGFVMVMDRCIETLFSKDGETVEDAKKRLSGKVVR